MSPGGGAQDRQGPAAVSPHGSRSCGIRAPGVISYTEGAELAVLGDTPEPTVNNADCLSQEINPPPHSASFPSCNQTPLALACWLRWLERGPIHQKAVGSISGQGHAREATD